MFYKSDLGIHKILLSIKKGLEKKYDYVLVISGDTGQGKSTFALHLMETWTKMIGKEIDEELINNINVDKKKWLQRLQDLKEMDINVFDEGAKGLSSKQYNEKFSKLMEQLFQVIRYKRFFTILVVPNFFRLDKFFREDRLRGLVYINKRGQYRYFTRQRVIQITGKNSSLPVKNMNLVQPIHTNNYPDYKGIMLKKYEEMKAEGVNNILNETINEISEETQEKGKKLNDVIKERVFELHNNGEVSGAKVAEILSIEMKRTISKNRVHRLLATV